MVKIQNTPISELMRVLLSVSSSLQCCEEVADILLDAGCNISALGFNKLLAGDALVELDVALSD